MDPVSIAQFMIGAAFIAVALNHLFIAGRGARATEHLLFAICALAAAGSAIALAFVYRASDVTAIAEPLGRGNQHSHVAVAEHVADLFRLQQRVDRHKNAAGCRRPKRGRNHLEAQAVVTQPVTYQRIAAHGT